MFKICAGLDLSLTNAGVAIITEPYNAKYWSFGYGIKSDSSERDKIERVIFIANRILRLLREFKVDRVGIENYGFASKGRLAMQGELAGVIKSQILIKHKMPIILAVNSIRKYLLGKAVKNKKVVKNHLIGLGYPPPNNLDESDALAVAHVVYDWENERWRCSEKYKIGLFQTIDYNLIRTVRA